MCSGSAEPSIPLAHVLAGEFLKFCDHVICCNACTPNNSQNLNLDFLAVRFWVQWTRAHGSAGKWGAILLLRNFLFLLCVNKKLKLYREIWRVFCGTVRVRCLAHTTNVCVKCRDIAEIACIEILCSLRDVRVDSEVTSGDMWAILPLSGG